MRQDCIGERFVLQKEGAVWSESRLRDCPPRRNLITPAPYLRELSIKISQYRAIRAAVVVAVWTYKSGCSVFQSTGGPRQAVRCCTQIPRRVSTAAGDTSTNDLVLSSLGYDTQAGPPRPTRLRDAVVEYESAAAAVPRAARVRRRPRLVPSVRRRRDRAERSRP